MLSINDISIRNSLKPGDIGTITYLHGHLYEKEYKYSISFESYVAKGLSEFYEKYDEAKDKVWICEHHDFIVGFLLLMHREKNAAQLRYFLILPAYRGIGLGNKLMQLFMDCLRDRGFASSYLWTTHELDAATSLYKKYGFVLTEEKESEAFGKLVREQKYEWYPR